MGEVSLREREENHQWAIEVYACEKVETMKTIESEKVLAIRYREVSIVWGGWKVRVRILEDEECV